MLNELNNFRKNILSAWIIVLTILCINFAPLLFNFIWGNHDWLPIFRDGAITSGLIEGRLTQYIISNFLFMGKILPIFSLITGLILYSTALVCLIYYFFEFKLKPLHVIILTTIATLPYIIELTYFHFITLNLLLWPVITTIALIYAKKALKNKCLLNTTLSSLFLSIVIAGYPAAINFFLTATCCFIIQKSYTENFSSLIKKSIPFAISFIIASLTLKGIFIYLQHEEIMTTLYNNDVASPLEIINNIPDTLKASLISFIRPQPYFPLALKLISALWGLYFSIVYLHSSSNINTLTLRIFLLIMALLCLKFSALPIKIDESNILTTEDSPFYMLRTDFYSYPIFLGFCALILTQNNTKLAKNLIFISSIILLCLNIRENYTFAKTQILGFNAESKLLERITARIQSHPNFRKSTYYDVVQTGEIPLRQKYNIPINAKNAGYYTLKIPFNRYWLAHESYNFYAPEKFVKNGTSIQPQNMSNNMINFLSNLNKVWPSENSLFLDNRYAIIILTQTGKKMITEQFKAIRGNIYHE